ncbi:MAG: OadG family protein [Clostridia bacterium]|nr:OadG family protein [Clostridia bacterium]
MTFADRMYQAGTGTLIGVMTVFAVLLILWTFIEVMHFVFTKATAPKKPKQEKDAPNAETQNVVSGASADADNTELIAVITAAVTCMMEAQGIPATSFKIKSFRRTN